MIGFKDYINENIIIPELPTIKYVDINYLNKILPDVKWYYNPQSPRAGSYYQSGKIEINLSVIKSPEDIYNFLYYELIHKIQDEKSSKAMWSYIYKGLKNNKKKFNNGVKEFSIVNKFEEMAYASTFALIIHSYNLDTMDESIEKLKNDNRFKLVFSTLIKRKKFKKYLYLYIEDLKGKINIKSLDESIEKTLPEYKNFIEIHTALYTWVF